jgi:YggT family protein
MNPVLAAIEREDVARFVYVLMIVYFVLIFVRVLLSWIRRIPYNRALSIFINFVTEVTDPYLNVFRRIIPPVRAGPAAIDLSPMVAIFVLFIVGSIVVGVIEG